MIAIHSRLPVGISVGINRKPMKKTHPRKRMTYLTRSLKYYKWASIGEEGKIPDLVLYNKKTGEVFPIPKVYVMSLHKFIPNYLDNIRITQGKRLRIKIKEIKENFRTKIKGIKESYKEKINKQRISAKARKEKK